METPGLHLGLVLLDDNDWLDKVGGFVLHEIQGFFDVFKALEGVGDETGKVESADGNQAAQCPRYHRR